MHCRVMADGGSKWTPLRIGRAISAIIIATTLAGAVLGDVFTGGSISTNRMVILAVVAGLFLGVNAILELLAGGVTINIGRDGTDGSEE